MLLDRVNAVLRDVDAMKSPPRWARPREILKQLVMTIEALGKDAAKIVKIGKCVLEALLEYNLMFKMKNHLIPHTLGIGTIKIVY